jgi:hypothetical protein
MIDTHEREAEEKAKRYELRVSVAAAPALLQKRIEDGENIANVKEATDLWFDDPEYDLRLVITLVSGASGRLTHSVRCSAHKC